MKRQKEFYFRVVASLYIVGLLLLFLLKFDGSFSLLTSTMETIKENRSIGIYNVNLVPFRQIRSYLQDIHMPYSFKTLAANVIAFIPLGCIINIKMNNKLKSLFICFIIILSIEMIQFFVMIGFFDVDDLILNGLGAVLGIFLSQIINKKM